MEGKFEQPQPTKSWYRRPWGIILIAVLALMIISAIVNPDGANPPAAKPEPTRVAAFKPEFKTIGAGYYAVHLPQGVSRAEVEKAAATKCAGEKICQVMGWLEADQMASAMPMLSREAEALKFTYLINRNSDTERAVWTCGATESSTCP